MDIYGAMQQYVKAHNGWTVPIWPRPCLLLAARVFLSGCRSWESRFAPISNQLASKLSAS
jgi:hypothetical protein